MAYKAIIAGASGLIGSNLLHILLQQPEYNEISILVRKELHIRHEKLKQIIVDFDNLGSYADAITGHAVFCCLGTTKAQTPDKEQYKKIDQQYPLQLAQIAKQNRVEQFHVITAIGADKKSSTFYLRLKGELEEDLKQMGLSTLHIYQPSMLVGRNDGSRFGETALVAVFKIINPLMIGGLKKYKSIEGHIVARAMFKKSLDVAQGTFTYTSDKIQSI